MSVEPVPDWLRPNGRLTSADLDHLPGLLPHTELIDGGLILVNPQRLFHLRTVRRLEIGLLATVPASLEVLREMSVVLGEWHRPEPDISIIEATAIGDGSQTWYPASAVHLVIEVVSPESRKRDRTRKPQLYAEAGIANFWRVEEQDDRPVVYVHALDPAKSSYYLTGIYHDRLKLSVPYEIDIDLEGRR
jgi:Uma2 family endonuclease